MRCEIIVKEGRRRRYIGFVVKSLSNRRRIKKFEMIDEIKKHCRKNFDRDCKELGIYLIRFNGEKGIVRCRHTEKENTIKLLSNIDKVVGEQIKIETVGTSGTIKSLVKKHMNSEKI